MIAGGMTLVAIPSKAIFAQVTTGKRYCMVIDVRRCTGCLSCTVSCSVENNVPEGRPRTKVGQMSVASDHGQTVFAFPNQCNHCVNPPCVKVCPVKATYKREEDGVVVIDYNKCIHCMNCVPACPYGARNPDPTHKMPPEKCNFCIHRLAEGLLPACVESCIGGARVFGDLNDPDSEVRRLVRENQCYALLPKKNTQPSIFYIGLPEVLDDETMLKLVPTQWQR